MENKYKGNEKAYAAAYYQAHKERARELQRAWQKANPDRVREYGASYRSKYPDKCAERHALARKRELLKYRARNSAWNKANPDKKAFYCATRRANLLKQTPAWADQNIIKEYYELALILSRMSGESIVVDHIIPLRGRGVRGLHTHDNLRLITKEANSYKGNRFEYQT